jgi:hypothetical protein
VVLPAQPLLLLPPLLLFHLLLLQYLLLPPLLLFHLLLLQHVLLVRAPSRGLPILRTGWRDHVNQRQKMNGV